MNIAFTCIARLLNALAARQRVATALCIGLMLAMQLLVFIRSSEHSLQYSSGPASTAELVVSPVTDQLTVSVENVATTSNAHSKPQPNDGVDMADALKRSSNGFGPGGKHERGRAQLRRDYRGRPERTRAWSLGRPDPSQRVAEIRQEQSRHIRPR